jgi:hypothetical protein
MGTTDPNCEPHAHAEQCERPFADDIGFGSGRVLIKRCHVRLRRVTRYARREVLADLIALRPPSGLPPYVVGGCHATRLLHRPRR